MKCGDAKHARIAMGACVIIPAIKKLSALAQSLF
jgi:hypothetical protein